MPLSKTLVYNKADNGPQGILTTNDKVFNWIIMPYLYGEEIEEIRHRLTGPKPPVKKDFKQCPIHDKSDQGFNGYAAKAEKILATLGITNPELQKKYLVETECNNVYQLLCHLYRDGHHHLATLIDMIDKSAPKRTILKRFALPTLIISMSVIAGALWDKYAHQSFKHGLHKFIEVVKKLDDIAIRILNSTKNIAFIGLGINLGELLYEAFLTRFDEKRNLRNKLYDFGFVLAASLFSIASYTITFLTNGTLSTVAAWLIVLSSTVAVSKAIISLRKAYDEFKKYKETFAEQHDGKTIDEALANNQLSLQEKAEYYRTLYHFKSRRMVLIQEIFTTIAVVLVIASWSFALLFPPSSIALIATSIAMLTLIQTLHAYFAEKSKQHFDNGLQAKLRELNYHDNKNEITKVVTNGNQAENGITTEPTFNPLFALFAKNNVENKQEVFEVEQSKSTTSSWVSNMTGWLHFPSFFKSAQNQVALEGPATEDQALLDSSSSSDENSPNI